MSTNNQGLPFECSAEIATIFAKRSSAKAKVNESKEPFLAAVKLLAQRLDIKIKDVTRTVGMTDALWLDEIASVSGFFYREIQLRGNWWQYDNGPLLAYTRDGAPCVLMTEKDDYFLIDPVSRHKIKIDEETAKKVETKSFYLYRSLPKAKLTLRDIFKFTIPPIKSDLKRVFFIQLTISLLGLLIPVATGLLFSLAIPFANLNLVAQVLLILLANAFIVTAFTLGQTISLFRFKLKADASLQPAIWNRIFNFPPSFFKKFSVGDLANRASGIDYIQQEFSMSLVLSLVSGIMSLVAIIFLFFLNVLASVLILIAIIVMMAVSLALTYREITYLRKNFNLLGKVYALLLQIINSIAKLRVANAENSILRLWVNLFSAKTRMFFRSGNIVVISQVFTTVFSTLILIVFYLSVVSSKEAMSLGTFIIYNSAFSQLLISLSSILAAANQLVRAIPLYERLLPILKTPVEGYGRNDLQPDLGGNIELDNLTFRYPLTDTIVSNELSFKVNAGEFIGIIGPSGAGKSTLLRLLLALETPESGKILYDGYDLASLNLKYFRRQLGVVLQNSMLMPGTILENIIGIHSQLTLEDAWTAVRLAKIEDEIKAMPMGMHTIIAEGGQSLSAGQRQRVLLARALVKGPKILLLDEAMSGLDDLTQRQIQDCLDGLEITRIIITQHPAILKNADRIIQIEHGRMIDC